jgi:3-dehydroquinate synthase
MIRSHITGNRALLITNDRIAPMHLEKYEKLLKDGGDDIQIGEL